MMPSVIQSLSVLALALAGPARVLADSEATGDLTGA